MKALVIIDMQKGFMKKILKKKRLVRSISKLIKEFRKKEFPVFHVISIHGKDRKDWSLWMLRNDSPGYAEGEEGAEIMDGLAPEKGEKMIKKTRESAFFNTALEKELKKAKITKIVLAGIKTEDCIRSTAIDAYQRNIEVNIPSRCISSDSRRFQRYALRYLDRREFINIIR